jgi:HEAT repeat protein/thiol-disulfide isomerase/thioredoxin
MRISLAVAVWFGLCGLGLADGAAPVEWHASFAEGSAAAQKSNRPLLVKFDATWCGWCRKFDEELAKPDVVVALARFEIVKVDIDQEPDIAKRFAVMGVPALRVLTPRGRLLTSSEGFLSAEDLLEWLGEGAQAEVAEKAAGDLATTGPPGLLEGPRIVKAFRSRDVAVREAAITRLRPYPKESVAAVLAAFRDGTLQARLSSLDLLRAWLAPTTGLDPWRPETLTQERLDALDAWGRTVVAGPEPAAWAPTDDEVAAAIRDMKASLLAPEAEAAAARERLARFGPWLMPSVLERLATVDDEAQRERLYALRYRLTAAPARVLTWPGGIERLASRDLKERREASNEFVRTATSQDEALLLELVADPDPLVRELALRGLQAASGEAASKALVKMLADPEPNVRAAVLKQWAEKPAASMLPELETYLAKEKEPDLAVHAVRVLRELGGAAAPLLVGLTKHVAWQVRAEAAEALGHIEGNSWGPGKQVDSGMIHEAYFDLLDDDDAYVASRGVEGLRGADLLKSVEPLLALAKARPELAPAVIATVVAGTKTREAADAELRGFVKHPEPTVRVAAIQGLAANEATECDAELLMGLEDADSRVRIAAASGVFTRARMPRMSAVLARQIVSPSGTGSPPGFLMRFLGSALGASAPPPPPPDESQETVDHDPGAPPKETALTPLLRRMAASSDQKEAVAGLKALVASGFWADVQEQLEALMKSDTSLIADVAPLLTMLDGEPRAKLLRLFIRLDAVRAAEATSWLSYDVDTPDPAAADLLWALCRDPRLNVSQALSLKYPLEKVSLGSDWDEAKQADRDRFRDDILERCRRGYLAERLLALSLLASAQGDEALVLCKDIMSGEAVLHPALESMAYRMILLGDSESTSRTAIQWGLETKDPLFVRPALAGLAGDWDVVNWWKPSDDATTSMTLSITKRRRDPAATAENPFDPAKPEGLTVEHLEPLAGSTDPGDEALVTYFRVLLDASTDIQPLVRLWEKAPDNDQVRRLLVRAIAYLDDPALTPILDRVFAEMMKDSSEWSRESAIKDFYWTIRIMNGPEIAVFRKRVRDESGISIR